MTMGRRIIDDNTTMMIVHHQHCGGGDDKGCRPDASWSSSSFRRHDDKL